jgi:hypothetical protein
MKARTKTMSVHDFNTATPAREFGVLMPAGTCAMVVLTLRPGGVGDDGWLKNTSAGDGAMLDMEFTIDGGPNNKRKFWGMGMVEGNGSSGHNQALDITRSTVRGILESARGVKASDESPAGVAGRQINGWGDLDGLRFPARIAIEKGGLKDKNEPKGDRFADKNVLSIAIPVDDPDYVSPGAQVSRAPGAGPASGQAAAQAAAPVAKPSWAEAA